MAISTSDVLPLIGQILNAASVSYGTIDDPLHPAQELIDAIKLAAAEIVNTILGTNGHMDRTTLVTSLTVTNGQMINQSEQGGVMIANRPGKPGPAGLIANLLYNPNGCPAALVNGWFNFQGCTISLTGASALIDIIGFTSGDPLSFLRYEYALAVAWGALTMCPVFENTGVETAGLFMSGYQSCLARIRDSKIDFPSPTQFTNQKGGG